MTGHRKWADEIRYPRTRRQRLAYARAKAELDGAWEVRCRYDCCVWWVSPDSGVRDELGGYGPIDCPCKRNDE